MFGSGYQRSCPQYSLSFAPHLQWRDEFHRNLILERKASFLTTTLLNEAGHSATVLILVADSSLLIVFHETITIFGICSEDRNEFSFDVLSGDQVTLENKRASKGQKCPLKA